MAAIAPDILLQADPPAGLIASQIEGFTALYHRRSGQTHIVAEPVPQILALLGKAPLTAPQLEAALSAENDLEAEGDLTAALLDRLSELEAIGLVWRA
jgi:PqqD family protein of HPr-rel-A system